MYTVHTLLLHVHLYMHMFIAKACHNSGVQEHVPCARPAKCVGIRHVFMGLYGSEEAAKDGTYTCTMHMQYMVCIVMLCEEI